MSCIDQFESFIPPGNLVSTCLSGAYSSTTGMTFVYMNGMNGRTLLADTTASDSSIARSLVSAEEPLECPPNWKSQKQLVPFT